MEGMTESLKGMADDIAETVSEQIGDVSETVVDAVQQEIVDRVDTALESASDVIDDDNMEVPSRPPPVAPAADIVASDVPAASLSSSLRKRNGDEKSRAIQDHLPSKEQVKQGVKKVRELLIKCQPLAEQALALVSQAEPHVERGILIARQQWKRIEKYHPEDLLPAVGGLLMVLFGSSFLVLITVLEAFFLTSWETTSHSFRVVVNNFMSARAAWKEDNRLDSDGNGIPDVKQLSDKQLIRRKLALLMQCIDPHELSIALTSIAAGSLAALAAVRTEFGRIIALGSAVGDVAFDLVDDAVVPELKALLPEEYMQWAAPTIRYTFKAVVFVICFFLFRILAVAHACLRGGQLMAHGVLRYLVKNNLAPQVVDSLQKAQSGLVFDGVCIGLAAVGFLFQWYFDFELAFPLNYLLFPLVVVEYIVSTLAWWM